MLVVPSFMKASLTASRCPCCKARKWVEGVRTLGLEAHEAFVLPTIEVACRRCGEVIQFRDKAMPMTLSQFAKALQEMAASTQELKNAPKDTTFTAANPRGPHLHFVDEPDYHGTYSGVYLFGGYRSSDSGTTTLLYRRYLMWMSPVDGLMKLLPRARLRLRKPKEAESNLPDDWDRFLTLPTNATFRLGGVTWRRITTTEMRKITEKMRYRFRIPKVWLLHGR